MYNFIYSSSDIYAPYCITSVASLLKNNPELDKSCFYILSNDISASNKSKLEKICSSYEAEVKIIDCMPVISSIFEGGGQIKF